MNQIVPALQYVALKALILEDNKLLLVKKKQPEFWDLPGGRMNPEEGIIQAFKREMNEELPDFIDYRIEEIVGLRKKEVPLRDGNELFLVYFKVESLSDQNRYTLSSEHTQYKFFSLKEILKLPQPLNQIYSSLLNRMIHPQLDARDENMVIV